jgi:hypothetical protein
VSDNYQRGDLLPCLWTPKLPAGAGQQSLLNITGENFDDMVLALDVTGTIHNGRRARIAGLGDAQGNVTLWFDLDNPPYASPPLIRSGCLGLLQINVSTSTVAPVFYTIGIIIEKVHWSSTIETALGWNFDWKESVLAGPFTYPVPAFNAPGGPPGNNPQGTGSIPGQPGVAAA